MLRNAWKYVVVGALAYTAGVEVARTQDAKMVHDSLTAADQCHKELKLTEAAIAEVEPILERLGPWVSFKTRASQ